MKLFLVLMRATLLLAIVQRTRGDDNTDDSNINKIIIIDTVYFKINRINSFVVGGSFLLLGSSNQLSPVMPSICSFSKKHIHISPIIRRMVPQLRFKTVALINIALLYIALLYIIASIIPRRTLLLLSLLLVATKTK